MTIKLIKSEKEYQEAILLLEKIGDNVDFENDETLIRKFELLEKLIADYESENYKLEKGDPIEIIKLKMDYMNLKQKDLIGVIGSKGVVSDVLNKKRGLSKVMIRNLSNYLGLNQDILNTDYKLQKDVSNKAKKEVNSGLLKFLCPRGIDPISIQKRVARRGTIVQICA